MSCRPSYLLTELPDFACLPTLAFTGGTPVTRLFPIRTYRLPPPVAVGDDDIVESAAALAMGSAVLEVERYGSRAGSSFVGVSTGEDAKRIMLPADPRTSLSTCQRPTRTWYFQLLGQRKGVLGRVATDWNPSIRISYAKTKLQSCGLHGPRRSGWPVSVSVGHRAGYRAAAGGGLRRPANLIQCSRAGPCACPLHR